MSLFQIVCENCGAKYRLPETSTASKAKCKQCGSVIDVEGQKAAAATAASEPAMPAAARPARRETARSGAGSSSARSGRAGGAGSRSNRTSEVQDGEEAPKSNKGLVIGGILGGAALLVVVAVLVLGGGKQPAKKDTAKGHETPAAKPAADANANAKPNTPPPVEAPAKKARVTDDAPSPLAPAAGGTPSPTPAPAAAPQGQGQKPAEPQKPPAAGTKPPLDPLDAEREKLIQKDLQAWQKLQVKSLDQVMDPKKTTAALDFDPSVTDDDKKKMADLLQKAKDGAGAARTKRALGELEKMGQPALVFLVNQLREIDYKNTDDAMWGYQLNMTLQNITMGVNTGYVPVVLDEKMDPRKAQWNAMTVQNWIDGVKRQWPTKAKYDEYIKARKAKKDAELEGTPPEEPKKK